MIHVGQNAKAILKDNVYQITNLKFTYLLGKMHVLPSVQQGYEKSNGFQIAIVNKTRRVLAIQEVSRRPRLEDIPAKCGRCFKFVKVIAGSNDYKKGREKLNNKLKSKCGKYEDFLGKFHVKSVENVWEDCLVEQ